MKSYVSDHQLIKEFVDGNPAAMDILISRHKQKVFNYLKFTVQDEMLAEDLFQDTFVKVINSLRNGNYIDEGRFVSWVMRIAHNLAIDHFRKGKNYKEVSHMQGEYDLFNDSKLSAKSIDDVRSKEQVLDEVKNIVKILPEEQRAIVIMRLYLDMSFKEIAELTNVSINTALGRMRYALINLRKIAEEKKLDLTY
ncbi:MAG: sigma-70 family RNA polymerase sigma factor [Bacteroidales bacterium]|nr:sigma-70 family RNA polymerase sigma factor [Bacteroidales bacterium]HPY81876.1 sigma-70 family RNA polymerase sigma factor [Bacteroidales bacterium]